MATSGNHQIFFLMLTFTDCLFFHVLIVLYTFIAANSLIHSTNNLQYKLFYRTIVFLSYIQYNGPVPADV